MSEMEEEESKRKQIRKDFKITNRYVIGRIHRINIYF